MKVRVLRCLLVFYYKICLQKKIKELGKNGKGKFKV